MQISKTPSLGEHAAQAAAQTVGWGRSPFPNGAAIAAGQSASAVICHMVLVVFIVSDYRAGQTAVSKLVTVAI
jgi:hypothetical protein